LHQRQSIKCHTISSSTKLHQSKQLQSQVQQVFIPLIEQSFETNTKWSSTNQITPARVTAVQLLTWLSRPATSLIARTSAVLNLYRSSFCQCSLRKCPVKVRTHSAEMILVTPRCLYTFERPDVDPSSSKRWLFSCVLFSVQTNGRLQQFRGTGALPLHAEAFIHSGGLLTSLSTTSCCNAACKFAT